MSTLNDGILNEDSLNAMLAKFEDIEKKLTEPLETDEIIRLSKDRAELEPVVISIRTLKGAQQEIADLKSMLADKDTDPDMRELAESELESLNARVEDTSQTLKLQLIPKDKMDDRNVILEVRAGTGGDEAALFAGDLFRMYERYASQNRWQVEVMSASDGSVGGYKEIIANIKGDGVFSRLKYESGVHRVQRVPDTETEGRVHTSAATVAVLPEAEDVDIEINQSDLKIDTYRASGAGGQHVNTTDSAIRITHIPTGIVVTQQDERSQHKNKAAALKILRAKIYTAEQDRLDKERADSRKTQVGSGDRSERIRTYNYPQGRVSDHRINLTLYKLPEIMEGTALDSVIDPLIIDHQTKLLAALDAETNIS